MKNFFDYYFKIAMKSIIYKFKSFKKKEIEYNKESKSYWEYEEKR